MKYISLCIVCLLPFLGIGQQDIILTNYNFNAMFFNPAAAGSTGEEAGSAILNYRNQWMGIEGSPQTILLGGEVNLFNDRVGLGLTLGRESIGIDKRIDLATNYAYRVEMDDAYLSLGIRAAFHFFNSQVTDIRSTDVGDNVYDQGNQNFNVFSVGAGAYYYREIFFVGLAVPAIASINPNTDGFKAPHYYLHTGAIFDLSEYSEMQVEPSILVKYQNAAPLQITLGTKLWLRKEFNVGVHYRTSDAVALSMEFVISEKLSIAAAYDFTSSELRQEQDGTVELLVGYKFDYGNGAMPMGRR